MFGIIRSLFVIIAAVAVIGGGTYSYFSAADTATGTLAAGTLTVDLLNQNATTPLAFSATGLIPGGTTTVNFDVKNGGTANTAVNLRGMATGMWAGSIVGANDTLVKVTKVERWDGSAWVTLLNVPAGITGMFYDSPDGTDAALYTIPAGGTDQFQVTVMLDTSAGDIYQGGVYNGTIAVQTRQSTATTWPATMAGF